MKIYVVGDSSKSFANLDNIREKYIVNEPHLGNNIDFLNPWYCELTGLYYLWKHNTDDIIGLEHYRRYFVNDNGSLISESEINDMLSNADMLLREYVFPPEYPNAISHFSKDRLPYMLNFVNSFEPTERQYFIDRLHTSKSFAQCNMFIGRREIIDSYMKWLLKHTLTIPFDTMRQSPRLIGYLAEFVFGFWLDYNGYKTKYCPSITL